MSTQTKPKGFVQRVLASFKGGDEAKLTRFHKKAIKHIETQIRLRTDDIDLLNEKIIDKQEDYSGAVLAIDFDAISCTEDASCYSEEYVSKLLKFEEAIEDMKHESEIKALEIERLETIKEKLGKA